MMPSIYSARERARQTFRKMYHSGQRQRFVHHLIGRETDLQSFEDERDQRMLSAQHDQGIRQVPIDAITGSVGREKDFDAAFRPMREAMHDRWVNVATAYYKGHDLPPVELYRMDGHYFVIDGNHRISVYKANGQEFVEAHVIDVQLQLARCQADDAQSPAHHR